MRPVATPWAAPRSRRDAATRRGRSGRGPSQVAVLPQVVLVLRERLREGMRLLVGDGDEVQELVVLVRRKRGIDRLHARRGDRPRDQPGALVGLVAGELLG